MKLNLRVSNIRKKYDVFTYILSELINQDIDIQINVLNLNSQTDVLIKKLDSQRFLNLDNFNKIPLHQFSDIFYNDYQLECNLKEYVAQKFDTQFSWFIQDQCIITHLDCQYQIDQFLDKLFYTQTSFKQYVDYLNTYHQIKVYSSQEDIPLRGYKKQNQQNNTQKVYTIYGYKKELKQQNVFEKKIVRHEHQFDIHNVFIEYYVPIIKQWIEKHLYTFVEVRRGQQIIDLYGPHHLVTKAGEILMKEYSTLNIQSGILKFKDLDDESIQLMQIQEILNQNQFYDYEVAKQSTQALDELQNSLKQIKSRIFSAILVSDFQNSKLCNNAQYYFNFNLDRNNIQIILENEVYQLSKTQINGKALSYFVIINGRVQQSIFLKKLNEDLEIVKQSIYNINQINYLRKLTEKEITNLQNKYQIKLKYNQNYITILGKQQQVDYFVQFLIKQISPQVEVTDFYFFKNRFNFNVVINDYKDKLQEMILQYECKNFLEEKQSKMKIISKDSIKIFQLKSQLEQLEKCIEKSKKTIQISIEKSLSTNLNQLIQQITTKYPSVDIIIEQNDNTGLKQVYSFTKQQAKIKIFFGQPNFLYDTQKEILDLKNSIILIPIEKIHNKPQPIQQQWVNELIEQNNITLINQKQNSSFELFQYQLNLQQKQIDTANSTYKYVYETVEFSIYHIYYRDYLKPQNYIHYFDKQNLNKSYGKLINDLQTFNPTSIIITSLVEYNCQELKGLIEYIKKADFPQIQISLMIDEKNDLTELKSFLSQVFDEENPNQKKQTYHISITGCFQETLNQIIKELNEI
ncbi:unnamed protein product [Paramecium primaurelia]|uniref:Uncharacterized protein n=1 Tax=Paramecium primaurelia TaxID=5886 RepID=A0A8S1MP61_PARPR|nr:unnamed protein product [Paramecium primaurelia]